MRAAGCVQIQLLLPGMPRTNGLYKQCQQLEGAQKFLKEGTRRLQVGSSTSVVFAWKCVLKTIKFTNKLAGKGWQMTQLLFSVLLIPNI